MKTLCYGWAVCSSLGIKALCFTAVFFPLQSQITPLLAIHWLKPWWDLSSHWLQGTPGRIQEPFFCLHAGREKPTNKCYLGQPGNLKLATQKRIMLEQITLPGCKYTFFFSWESRKWCGFFFWWDFILLAADCYSVGVCSCVCNKQDHISWYWHRKNLI